MRTYLVTYDLNNPGQKHQSVLDTIKNNYSWARLSESSYTIYTSETPQDIYKRFAPFLDGNDNLYVIHLNRNYYGQGPQDVNDWLNKHL